MEISIGSHPESYYAIASKICICRDRVIILACGKSYFDLGPVTESLQ